MEMWTSRCKDNTAKAFSGSTMWRTAKTLHAIWYPSVCLEGKDGGGTTDLAITVSGEQTIQLYVNLLTGTTNLSWKTFLKPCRRQLSILGEPTSTLRLHA